MESEKHPELIKFIKTYVFWMTFVGVLVTAAYFLLT